MRKFLLFGLLAGLCTVAVSAQVPNALASGSGARLTPGEVNSLRHELLSDIASTPQVAAALAADPSLLSVPDYLERVNPPLALLAQQHPEIARNPDFYLFSDLGPGDDRGLVLERRLWPESIPNPEPALRNLVPLFAFLIVVLFVAWLLRTLLGTRRWSRQMRVQSDAHNRLLEKFGNAQELLTYMQSEAGRRFLESAPLEAGLDTAPRAAGLAGRLLLSLQCGIVLGLGGAALYALRNSIAGGHDPMLVFGALGIALGVGLILSAGVAFLMARHLNLIAPARPGGVQG